jgi:hypothetical protein
VAPGWGGSVAPASVRRSSILAGGGVAIPLLREEVAHGLLA